MKINDSIKLYLGLIEVIRACVNDVQVWPSFYIWNKLGTPAFTGTDFSKAGYSMSVAKTSSGKTRVAIGMPFANSNYGEIKVFEFSADYSTYQTMIFNPTSMSQGKALSGYPIAGHRLGKSIALSNNGQVLVVGAPCAVTVEDVGGWTPGLIRVFSCAADSTVWSVNGVHTNGNGLTDSTNGYVLCPATNGGGGINGGDKFGFAVALNDIGSVIYASYPNSTPSTLHADGSGGIFQLGKNSANTWVVGSSFSWSNTTANNRNQYARLGKNIKLVNNLILVATTKEGNTNLFHQAFTAHWSIGSTSAVSPNIIWHGDGQGSVQASGTDPDGLNNDAIDLSGNGLFVAIGFPNASSNRGQVKVFKLSDRSQVGGTITGPSGSTARLGTSVSLNNDGTILAIGSRGSNSVMVYKLVGSVWKQYSQQFNGDAGSLTGFSVDLSSDATKLFYTSPLKLEGGVQRGGLDLQAFPAGSKIYPNL